MSLRPTDTARKSLTLLALSLVFAVAATAAAAGSGLPVPVPVPNLPLPLPGSGSGGPVGGGGPGGSGPGGLGLTGTSGAAGGIQFAGSSFGDFRTINAGPNDRFGDPLSTDLLGNDRVHAHLRYYGESGAVGTSQAVGISLTFAQ